MVTHSAGIVLWRSGDDGEPEILLVHPGGPFWSGKVEHAWSIPKGEFDPVSEAAEECARREFAEELGTALPTAVDPVPLAVVKASGKHIHPFLVEGDFDPSRLVSNTTEIEWPPRSGRRVRIPEVDAAAWVRLAEAERLLHKGQAGLPALVRFEVGGGQPG
jgi:predicted NUDIX family NTP pyrophosphohydrolase